MKHSATRWPAVVGVVALSIGVLVASRALAVEPRVREVLQKIAKLIEKGDEKEARKQAEALARTLEELNDVEHAYKLRGKGGLGVGREAGKVTPDGLELWLNAGSRDGVTPKALEKNARAFEEAAWMIAALSEVNRASAHSGKTQLKDRKREEVWLKLSAGVGEGARELAAAIRAKNVDSFQMALRKINHNCNSCHFFIRRGVVLPKGP